MLQDVISTAGGFSEDANVIVSRAWDSIVERRVWDVSFPSLSSYKQHVSFNTLILPFLQRQGELQRRIARESTRIFAAWNIQPLDIFAAGDRRRPLKLTGHLVRALEKLANISADIPLLQRLLSTEIRHRTRTSGRLKGERLTPQDVEAVVLQLRSQPRPPLPPPAPLRSPSKAPRDVKDTPANDSGDSGDNGDNGGDGEEPMQDVEQPSPGEQDALDHDSGDEPEPEEPEPEDKEPEDEEPDDDEPEDDEPENDEPPTCACPASLRSFLMEVKACNDRTKLHSLLLTGIPERSRFCRDHLRIFAGKTAGLITNVSTEVLLDRMRRLPKESSFEELQGFRDALSTRNWFRTSHRFLDDRERLEPFLYPSITNHSTFTFDARQVLNRTVGRDVYDEWQSQGNLILNDLMSYLNHPSIARLIDDEFDLYKHHFQPHRAKAAMGFRRNMMYSLVQQMVRQDPGYYAVNASCRSEPHWRLITYPYVTKDSEEGQQLGFLHVDINVCEYVKHGTGRDQLTSSVSLDDETADGCTVLVPRFHHRCKEWVERVRARGHDIAGATTPAKNLYLPEDVASFGPKVPFPCAAGGVRITDPAIIHGATAEVQRRRRLIFPWHTRIQEDHEQLEIPGQHTWSELAACHRDMVAPLRGVSGNAVAHSRPKDRFPAAVQMTSSSALSDALIGRRRWTDPEVIEERNVLLGSDDAAALRYIHEVRRRLMQDFVADFVKLERYERQEFGVNSFFVCRDNLNEIMSE